MGVKLLLLLLVGGWVKMEEWGGRGVHIMLGFGVGEEEGLLVARERV